MPIKMRILTLNINFYEDKHGPWSVRRKLIADAIRETEPDIVAMQAVGRDVQTETDQVTELAGFLSGYEPRFEPINGEQGMGFLSRLPITQTHKRELTRRSGHEDEFDRIVLHAAVESPIGSLSLFNAHFSWVDEQASDNVDEALHFLDSFGGPRILVGDFNQTSDKPSIRILNKNGWTDSYAELFPSDEGFTFEAGDPSIRIDYAFVSKELSDRIDGVEVIENSADGARMSNHFGVLLSI
jgi:endonuclease/exonuclease/phosphatase family metal-dependent hydrolase